MNLFAYEWKLFTMRRCPPGLSLKTRLNKYNDIYFALYFVPRIICCSNIPRSVCISSVHRTFWGRKGLRWVKSDWFLFHFLIPSCRESLRQFREMKRLPFLVSLAFINTMFCARVDFKCRVIFTFLKEIEANGMKGCGWTQKLNPRSTFTATHKPLYIASFIFVRKINARTRVKITRRWKPTVRCLLPTGHCLIFNWRVLSPKSRTFSPNDIYLYLSLWGMAVERDWRISLFRTFFLHQTRLLTSQLIFMAQNANTFIIRPLCSIFKATQGKFWIS